MASDRPSPFLVDAVKASASRFKETKNALEARQRELDAREAELQTRAADLERQAERLKGEREEFQKDKEQVTAARATIDHDLGTVRVEREKSGAEERRVQEWARTLNDREKAIKDNEDRVKRLDMDLSGHLKESEGKEKSLIEAERYLAAALEASGIDVAPEEERSPPPPPMGEPRAPKPPVPPPTAPPNAPPPIVPPIRTGESLRDEIFEEEHAETRPKVSRADALERMTRALETAKKARDLGRNVSDIRKVLKQARAAFESGEYDTASRLAEEILRELEAIALAR